MQWRIATLLAAVMVLSMMAVPAAAGEHGGSPPDLDEPHPHVLLLGADVTDVEEPDEGMPPYIVTDYDKCVDLAGGQTMRHNRFHDNVHFGRAGAALRAAGHIVLPFANCDTVDELPFVDVNG